jgi:hypothetical protein
MADTTTYSVNQIIGKTLIAKRRIDLYRGSQLPNGNSFAFVAAGGSVGVVYSYITVDGLFFWMFLDNTNTAYYAPHGVGFYDISALQQQGALNTQQVLEQQQEQQNSIFPDLPSFDILPDFNDIILPVGLLILGVTAIKKLL